MTATTANRPLETGWLPDTPVDDSVLRRFLHNQADLNEAVALAAGGRATRSPDVFLADACSPVAYSNQAILARPVLDDRDPVLDVIDEFFAGTGRPSTVLSLWPAPDLRSRGWHLAGHPMMVLRPPSPVDRRRGVDVATRLASSAADLEAAERIAVEGYPFDEARDAAPGAVLPPAAVEWGLVVRLGVLDGHPVAMGNRFIAHGVVNLCLGATLPAARRRGVWEALVWARVSDAPELPAVAYTSDDSRPGFLRMGFLPVTRFSIWSR